MTGNRTSAVWKPEQKYGVEDTGANWHRFPTGLRFSFGASNGFTKNVGIGSRYWESATAGKYSGTWSAKFEMDYKCIQILPCIFDTYTYSSGNPGIHTFTKEPGSRCKSMTFKAKKMNRFIGGTKDSTYMIYGAVCNNINMTMGSKGVIDVTIGGFYKTEELIEDDLSNTDWKEYYGNSEEVQTVEWSCINIDGTPVATTDSVSFGVNSGAEGLTGCGSRFITNYFEKGVTVSCTTSCYSYEPSIYLKRMYSGGFDNTHTAPMEKGLSPLKKIELKSSYNMFSMNIEMENVLVDSAKMSEWGESKITDTPTFIPGGFKLVITSTTQNLNDIWNPKMKTASIAQDKKE